MPTIKSSVTFKCADENEDWGKGKRPGFKFHMNEPQRKASGLGVGVGVGLGVALK